MTAMTEPADFTLARDAFGRLVLTQADGTLHAGVLPVRAFPLTSPGEGLSLVGEGGHEVAWVASFDALPAAARALIEQELAVREFAPEIRQLMSVSTFSTPSVWRVETDRGETEFTLSGEEDIRRLSRTRLLILSASGVQFRVPDLTALDRASRRLLERFL
ncbi:MAG: DUF1854 domain-containing protein [Burkholderiales bacterium]|jgi:hypothetical protein|nr:DUF1854 domain-containing protein [Burkholderiales bacterium]